MSSQATEIEQWRDAISRSWGPETRDLLANLEGEGLHLSVEGGELVCVPDPGREDILRDADVRELVWQRRHDLEAALRDPKRDLRGIRFGPHGAIARQQGTVFETGVHAKVVSERLGHSTIRTTLDVYSHTLPTMQEDATDRLERSIFGEEAEATRLH